MSDEPSYGGLMADQSQHRIGLLKAVFHSEFEPVSKGRTAENVLSCLTDLRNYPNESLAPYEEFILGGQSYYFAPGGSLYRKDEPEIDKGAEVENLNNQKILRHSLSKDFTQESSSDAPFLSNRLLDLPAGIMFAGVWLLGATLIGLGVLAFYFLAQLLVVAASAA